LVIFGRFTGGGADFVSCLAGLQRNYANELQKKAISAIC